MSCSSDLMSRKGGGREGGREEGRGGRIGQKNQKTLFYFALLKQLREVSCRPVPSLLL